MNFVIGIDPGLEGAIAVLSNGNFKEFFDIPTFEISGAKKKKRDLDVPNLVRCLERFPKDGTLVMVERLQVMPAGRENGHTATPGLVSTGSFMCNYGIILGVVAGLKLPYELVLPQAWKKAMMPGQGKDKDASRQVATRLFPATAPHLNLKKHHNRADALLIAAYGSRRLQQEVAA